MSRLNQVLVGLLLVQLAVIGLGLAFCGGEDDQRAARVLLLEGVERDAVERIRIQDDQERSVVLARQGEGWVLPEQYGYPAEGDRVEKLLGTLLGLESSHIVSRSGEHRVELEVAADEFRRMVEIEAGDVKQVLFVGGTGETGLTHVSRSGQPEVYAIDGMSPWDLPAGVRDWVRKTVLDIDKQEVASIGIQKGGKDFRLVQGATGEWRIEPAAAGPIDAAKVDDLLNDLLQVAPSAVRGTWSDPAVREAIAGNPGRVRLALGLRATPDAQGGETEVLDGGAPPQGDAGIAAAVPPPAPITAGPADGGAQAEGGTSAADGTPVAQKTRTLLLAPHPDKQSAALLHAEGAAHLIEVDRWRVRKLLGFDPADLAPGDPAGDAEEP